MKRENYSDNVRFAIYGVSALSIIVIVGCVGYMIIEGYSFIDALYMTMITLSTVGFGEVMPLSNYGKIFTVVLIFFSLNIFGYLVTSVARFVVDGALQKSYKYYKVRKKIEKLEDHVIVCGYGRNGYQACMELYESNQKFVIIEKRDHVVDMILEHPDFLYIQGDASSEAILEFAQIRKAKAIITALPNDADNMFIVVSAREMNPNLLIVSRASEFRSDIKLRHAGASNVIMPDKMGGQHMAKLVTQPDVIEFVDKILLQHKTHVRLVEISCTQITQENSNKTINELDLRKKTGVNLMGLKTAEGRYIFNPSPQIKISPQDKIFLLGTNEQIANVKNILMS